MTLRAIVTGGGQGIGAEIVRGLVAAGYWVGVLDQNAAAAESLQQQSGNLAERVSTFNIGDRAEMTDAQPTTAAATIKEKHKASVAVLSTGKKLAPKVPSSNEWETF